MAHGSGVAQESRLCCPSGPHPGVVGMPGGRDRAGPGELVVFDCWADLQGVRSRRGTGRLAGPRVQGQPQRGSWLEAGTCFTADMPSPGSWRPVSPGWGSGVASRGRRVGWGAQGPSAISTSEREAPPRALEGCVPRGRPQPGTSGTEGTWPGRGLQTDRSAARAGAP